MMLTKSKYNKVIKTLSDNKVDKSIIESISKILKKTNSVRSNKNKGMKFQDDVARHLAKVYNLEYGTDKDLKGRPAGNAGTDIVMSKEAKNLIPFDIECKKCETWRVNDWWEQTTTNTESGRIPLLIASKNRYTTLAILEFETLISLINSIPQPSSECIKTDEIKRNIEKIRVILDNIYKR